MTVSTSGISFDRGSYLDREVMHLVAAFSISLNARLKLFGRLVGNSSFDRGAPS